MTQGLKDHLDRCLATAAIACTQAGRPKYQRKATQGTTLWLQHWLVQQAYSIGLQT
jgi:hypothetical protein